MKCVKYGDNSIARVSNDEKERLIDSEQATYCSKGDYKKARAKE